MWTLVDPSVVSLVGSHQRLSLLDAIKASEMHLLGDGMLATEPPLTFSVIMDRDKERVVERLGNGEETRAVTIGGVEVLSAGQVITDPDERNWAWILLLHGDWPQKQESQFDKLGWFVRVDFVSEPETPDEEVARQIEEQGLAFFGCLGKLYVQRFLDAITTDEGEIRAMREEPEPALLAKLVADDYWERDHVLKIWRFRMYPQGASPADMSAPVTSVGSGYLQ
ncbi:hypothetical protein [Streptomyces sp. NPDC046371]|uniref:hypothetical protein n=1 Tax=Streptomyces sp. NPDC046371 TaxID=3154916 RepID=UPI0033F11CDE